jgi:hypothetical protein
MLQHVYDMMCERRLLCGMEIWGLMGWKIIDGIQRKFSNKQFKIPKMRLTEEQKENLVETVREGRFCA